MNYSNLAQRTNFIASSDKFYNVPFFLTSVNIPGISIQHPEIGGRGGAALNIQGNTVTFNTLSLEMLIDEDYLIYEELMNIINKNVDVENGTFKDFFFNFFVEVTNSKGNKVMKVDFYNCRIESIGDIELNTQDESNEMTLSLELKYDYFVREPIKRYKFIKTEADVIPTNNNDVIYLREYFEEFNDLSKWKLWGFPLPILSSDLTSLNGAGFDSNGGATNESGAVLNNFEINLLKPFKFTFRSKQPLAENNESFYLDFGVTRGIGIESTTNGRTGETLLGIKLDSSGRTDYTIESESIFEMDNDGEYHEYTVQYSVSEDLTTSAFTILKDGIEKVSNTFPTPSHDFGYLYIQGKSVNGVHIVDRITGEYS